MKCWITIPSIGQLSFGGLRNVLIWFTAPDIIVRTSSFGIPEDEVFSLEWIDRVKENIYHGQQYRLHEGVYKAIDTLEPMPRLLHGLHLQKKGQFKLMYLDYTTFPHNNCIKLVDFLGYDHPISGYVWSKINDFYSGNLEKYMGIVDQREIKVYYPRFDFILELDIDITLNNKDFAQ